MHDLLIRGAEVADGLGNPLERNDVAVTDGRITAIGRIGEPARRTVEADGLVLAPGIVDLHTHYDAQLTWDSTASPSPWLIVRRLWRIASPLASPAAAIARIARLAWS